MCYVAFLLVIDLAWFGLVWVWDVFFYIYIFLGGTRSY